MNGKQGVLGIRQWGFGMVKLNIHEIPVSDCIMDLTKWRCTAADTIYNCTYANSMYSILHEFESDHGLCILRKVSNAVPHIAKLTWRYGGRERLGAPSTRSSCNSCVASFALAPRLVCPMSGSLGQADVENDVSSACGAIDQDTARDASYRAFRERLRSFRHADPVSAKRETRSVKVEAKEPTVGSALTPIASPLRKRAASSSKPSPSSSPSRKQRKSSGYAPPSRYANLNNLLRDVLEPNLLCVFVGVNPGIATATQGHAYAHPSNLFWKLLHASGLTDRRCRPDEDRDLPRLYMLGNTNIVERPTKDQSELSKEEMIAGTPILEDKFRRYRPEVVCIVGKGIWEAIWKYRYGRAIRKDEFRWGWQDERENMGRDPAVANSNSSSSGAGGWQGARVFVATSTSGLAASMRPPEKEAIWKPLGEWVSKRRAERLTQLKRS